MTISIEFSKDAGTYSDQYTSLNVREGVDFEEVRKIVKTLRDITSDGNIKIKVDEEV